MTARVDWKRILSFGLAALAIFASPARADEPPDDALLKAAALKACACAGRSLVQSMAERQDLGSEAEALAALNELLPDTYVRDFDAFAESADAKLLVRFTGEALAANRFDEASCRYMVPLAIAVTSAGGFASYGLDVDPAKLGARPELIDAIRDNCEAATAGIPIPPICDFAP